MLGNGSQRLVSSFSPFNNISWKDASLSTTYCALWLTSSTHILSTSQNAVRFKARIRIRQNSQPEHPVDPVAFLGEQVFKSFGHCASVTLHQSIPVVL